jgi:antitoxin (DNA-binding transcriptional repressor) of toxin-antitoxin stability system
MKTETISVSKAARNFADCVNRVRYEGVSFDLVKNGNPVASIVPCQSKPITGARQAQALSEALKKFRLGKDEAEAWLRDLDEARENLPPVVDKWQS